MHAESFGEGGKINMRGIKVLSPQYMGRIREMKTIFKPENKVLDVGCGTGDNLFELDMNDGIYIGVDISRKSIKSLSNHCKKNKKMHVILASAECLPIKKNFINNI